MHNAITYVKIHKQFLNQQKESNMAILQGTAYWAAVTTPNTTFEPVYTVNLVVDETTAEAAAGDGRAGTPDAVGGG